MSQVLGVCTESSSGARHGQEVRAQLGSQGLFVPAWGCPDFRELLELVLVLVLAQSFLKGTGGDEVGAGLHCGLTSLEVSGSFEGHGTPFPLPPSHSIHSLPFSFHPRGRHHE